VCDPFLITNGLGVQVESRADVGVPEQFALHLHIRTVRPEQCAVAVSERVPAHPLRDSRPLVVIIPTNFTSGDKHSFLLGPLRSIVG
jgi:hypothetical protein